MRGFEGKISINLGVITKFIANDKLYIVQMMDDVLEKVGNAGYHHFHLFQQYFQKLSRVGGLFLQLAS